MALTHSESSPTSVRAVTAGVADWIGRLGAVWVEGQLSEVKVRPGAPLVFTRLRDIQADASLSLVIPPPVFAAVKPTLTEGDRVVVFGKLEFWGKRSELHLRARSIRAVGVGELLARLEQLRALLAAEGLFAPERKKALPFLPRRIGVICGRNSEAERDVVANASRRWPGIGFEIRGVAVQGPGAAGGVAAAVAELDSIDEVDVIIITRGGGSVEDLLPFSDETLLRAVAAASTPIISAIGHERDRPLLDDVADDRASTPTDAARRAVPDRAEETQRVSAARQRLDSLLHHTLLNAEHAVAALRHHPALREPQLIVQREAEWVSTLRTDARRTLSERLTRATETCTSLQHRLHALSPAATLERGYAVVHNNSGLLAISAEDVAVGTDFHVTLSQGSLTGQRLPDPVDQENS
jgi:exodeoxyribonuclease VII large subunit